MSTTGRRPTRSERAPGGGEHRNCMTARALATGPYPWAAAAVSPLRKVTTSFGSTGTMVPSASMSSSTVAKMNAKAARRGGSPARAASAASGFPAGVGIGLLPQREADRRPGQIERRAQPVDEIAAIGVGNSAGARAEYDEARRPGLDLRDVVEPERAACRGGRRMLRERLGKPSVQRVRWHAAVPHRVRIEHRLHQTIDAHAV